MNWYASCVFEDELAKRRLSRQKKEKKEDEGWNQTLERWSDKIVVLTGTVGGYLGTRIKTTRVLIQGTTPPKFNPDPLDN